MCAVLGYDSTDLTDSVGKQLCEFRLSPQGNNLNLTTYQSVSNVQTCETDITFQVFFFFKVVEKNFPQKKKSQDHPLGERLLFSSQ